TVDFGLVDLRGSASNCQVLSNLMMATTCYAFGPRSSAAQDSAIVSFTAQAGSTNRIDSLDAYDDAYQPGSPTKSTPHMEARTELLGTVNGMTYQRSMSIRMTMVSTRPTRSPAG